MQQALFGGGCFWCVEAVFLQLKGVEKVVSGYVGGIHNQNYEQVCQAIHSMPKVVLIDFDEQQISYSQLLNVFLPPMINNLNRQGNDVGHPIPFCCFYFNDEQNNKGRTGLFKRWKMKA